MIITGYQGIGKSTLAKRRQDIIDLEISKNNLHHYQIVLGICMVQ